MSTHRVAITGVGLLSPWGDSPEDFCARLFAGACCIEPVELAVPDGANESRLAAAVRDPIAPACLPQAQHGQYSQVSLAALYCAERAFADAGLEPDDFDTKRAGVIVGSGFTNLYDLEPVYQTYFAKGPKAVSPLTIPRNMANAPVGAVSRTFGCRGVVKTVSTACSSGSSAVVEAARLIQDGYQDVVLAGGIDMVSCSSIVLSWDRLRVLSPEREDPARACRPFDRDRNGLVLGDGGALFVLENWDHAVRRGATILAQIKGSFENADAFDVVKPSSADETVCIGGALKAAGLDSGEIDLVLAHGTATRLNDQSEYQALRAALGDGARTVPLAAIKSMVGHTMGASGPMSMVAALDGIRHGYHYPIPNFSAPDDGVQVNIAARGTVRDDIANVLVNTFAFGGVNCAIVVSKPA